MRLQLNNPSFLNPKYELVALRPEHFLPAPTVLLRYDLTQGSHKAYVPSPDRRLRESPGDLTCPPFSGPSRQPDAQLNPFLVILDADKTFRRYFNSAPPRQPLPRDVLQLMKDTMELVDMICWKPGKIGRLGLGMKLRWGPDSTQEDLDLQTRVQKGYTLLFGNGGAFCFLVFCCIYKPVLDS